MEAAKTALTTYLGADVANEQLVLSNLLHRADIQFRIGKGNEARRIMSEHVNDGDLLPVCPDSVGKNVMIMAQRTENLRKTKSLEAIFLTCVQTRLWSRAAAPMDMIEETSPGYFTSVSSYTNLWSWERCLYAGLVMENESSHQEANLYFSQARGFLISWTLVLGDD